MYFHIHAYCRYSELKLDLWIKYDGNITSSCFMNKRLPRCQEKASQWKRRLLIRRMSWPNLKLIEEGSRRSLSRFINICDLRGKKMATRFKMAVSLFVLAQSPTGLFGNWNWYKCVQNFARKAETTPRLCSVGGASEPFWHPRVCETFLWLFKNGKHFKAPKFSCENKFQLGDHLVDTQALKRDVCGSKFWNIKSSQTW